MGSGGLGKAAEGYFTHLTRSSVDTWTRISSKNPVRGQTKFGIRDYAAAERFATERVGGDGGGSGRGWPRAATAP